MSDLAAVWAHLPDAGRRRIHQLISRSLRNNDRPTLVFEGPCTAHASSRKPGTPEYRKALLGGEQVTLSVVTEITGARMDLVLSFVPLSSSLMKENIRHLKLNMAEALRALPAFENHVQQLIEVDDNAILANARKEREEREERRAVAESEAMRFRSSEEWGEF